MTGICFRGFSEEEASAFETALLRVLENVQAADRNSDRNITGADCSERKQP